MTDLHRRDGLADFDGRLPLFPLPGVVLFPCSLLPLHIFEPRYRALVTDALAKDGRIGMVMLQPGWEADYYGNPPVHVMACLGKIVEATELPDGRYNIVLCGERRARIESIVSESPYRTARVALVDDACTEARADEAARLLEELLDMARRVPASLYRHKNVANALRKLDAPLGCSTDLLADSLLLSAHVKQELLECPDPIARARRLLAAVDRELAVASATPVMAKRYPPTPSLN
jgi:Lon protease-like protein